MREKHPNQRLWRERELKGWSRRKLAELLETNEQVVYRWEKGKHKPSRHFQALLCELFGKNAEELGFMNKPEVTHEKKEGAFTTSSAPILLPGQRHDFPPDFSRAATQGIIKADNESEGTIQQSETQGLEPGNSTMALLDLSRREALQHITTAFGMLTTHPRIITDPDLWERLAASYVKPSVLNTTTLHQLEHLIVQCWQLSNNNELDLAERLLGSFLPEVIALPPHEKRIAYLASHGLRLQSVLAHHGLRISEKVLLCEQSVAYARVANDPNTLVPALIELADAYEFDEQIEKCLKTLQEALHYCPHASLLVQSRAYSNYAIILARTGRRKEAAFYISLAQDMFPDDFIQDPGYALADASIYTLSYHSGLVCLYTHQESHAIDTFEYYKQHASDDSIPERLRLEIINGQSKAAILENELERYASFLECAIDGALALRSRKRFDEAYTIFRQDMPLAWFANSHIQTVAEKYQLERE